MTVGAGLLASGQTQQFENTGGARFRLSSVGYVMLGTADIKTATEFYGSKLGLKIVQQTDDVVFFDAGKITIVISTAVGRDPGSTEIVFSVDSVQAAYEALTRQGLVFENTPHQVSGSSWAANFRDPDRHILSLFGPK